MSAGGNAELLQSQVFLRARKGDGSGAYSTALCWSLMALAMGVIMLQWSHLQQHLVDEGLHQVDGLAGVAVALRQS